MQAGGAERESEVKYMRSSLPGDARRRGAHAVMSLVAVLLCSLREGTISPGPLSGIIAICGTSMGQLSVFNLFVCYSMLMFRAFTWAVFGKLRVIEWQVRLLAPAPPRAPSLRSLRSRRSPAPLP